MKVLVTGGSGFVGSTLCDELCRQGHDVALLMRKNSKRANLSGAEYRVVEGDLRNLASLADAVRDAEIIFHVAGIVTAKSKREFFKHNAEGTANLAEAAVLHAKNLQRFVYVSSLAAGGPSQQGKEKVETDGATPVSFYGESKLAGEDVLRRLNGRLPSVIIRPPAVYGPRDRGVFTFFELVSYGIRPALGLSNPDPHRYSFVHVQDLVQGILAAAFSSKRFSPAEIFYISGDGVYSWDEAMLLIAEALDRKTIRLPLPLFLMKTVALVCSGISKFSPKTLPLSPDKMKELEVIAWVCSNQKAKMELGFTPMWDLRKGFKQTADWYLARGWL